MRDANGHSQPQEVEEVTEDESEAGWETKAAVQMHGTFKGRTGEVQQHNSMLWLCILEMRRLFS